MFPLFIEPYQFNFFHRVDTGDKISYRFQDDDIGLPVFNKRTEIHFGFDEANILFLIFIRSGECAIGLLVAENHTCTEMVQLLGTCRVHSSQYAACTLRMRHIIIGIAKVRAYFTYVWLK